MYSFVSALTKPWEKAKASTAIKTMSWHFRAVKHRMKQQWNDNNNESYSVVSRDPVISQVWKYNAASEHPLVSSQSVSLSLQLRYWSWQAMQPETTRRAASHRVTSCWPSPTTRSWTRSAAAHPPSLVELRFQHVNVYWCDTITSYSRQSGSCLSCLWSALVAPERCDHCSWRSPAQHPPRAAGQEEGSEGETGDSRLAGSREEAQSSQKNSGQEDEWEKGRRKSQGAAQLECVCWFKQNISWSLALTCFRPGSLRECDEVSQCCAPPTETGWGEQGCVGRQHHWRLSRRQLHRPLHQESLPGTEGQFPIIILYTHIDQSAVS